MVEVVDDGIGPVYGQRRREDRRGGWEMDELRDPFALRVDGRLYLYDAGGRETGIGVAVADL